MEAGHLGAGRENSMGLNIMLPFEQYANPVIAGDAKLVHMKYFFTRKLMFVKECDAVCLLPGGFGTLDEGLEVLTLLQTGKREMVPVVFLDAPGGDLLADFSDFVQQQLLGRGMISPEDLSLYKLTDNVDVAVGEILQFFRVYHSMRYVKNKLVLRLTQRSEPRIVERDQRQLRRYPERWRIDVGGAVARRSATKPIWSSLPRLVFHFNRRNLGRLRQLIDAINRGSLEESAAVARCLRPSSTSPASCGWSHCWVCRSVGIWITGL